MEKNRYYSLVTDRISELKNELDSLIISYNNEDDVKKKGVLELNINVLNEKLKFLKDIENLPMFVSLNSFSNIRIYDKITRNEVPFYEVQNRLGLGKVREIMSRNKITTLSYLKELFINDYDAMKDLIDLHDINFICNEKIRDLYNKGDNSIAQISIRERQFIRLETKTNEVISELENDYSFDTLKEVNHYMRNSEEKLSKEFILKHQDKVIKNNPEMANVIKKLNKKDRFKFVSKFFKSKRNNNEELFIKGVIEYYKKDNRLNIIGMNSSENLLQNSYSIKKFIKKLDKSIVSKRNELKKTREDINLVRNSIMREIKSYETLREEKKNSFISLLKSKTNFLPKMFREQLWNEPCLKESLIKVACLEEENKLMNEINSYLTLDIRAVENKETVINKDVNVRRLTA